MCRQRALGVLPSEQAKTGKLPAIFLFKANAKDAPIQYFGAHDVESLEEFVREHVSLCVVGCFFDVRKPLMRQTFG